MTEQTKEILLKKVFGDKRIVGLAGERHSGKTNTLCYLIVDYRKHKPQTPIYVFGMPCEVMTFLKKYNVQEISNLKHLVHKKDCILILDEFQKLNLNNKRYHSEIAEFFQFVYHNNVYVILSTPDIREFNSIGGSLVERWALKTIREDMCVNGSQLKEVVNEYKGKYKSLKAIEVPVNELLIVNDDQEIVIQSEYIKEADSKKTLTNLFG